MELFTTEAIYFMSKEMRRKLCMENGRGGEGDNMAYFKVISQLLKTCTIAGLRRISSAAAKTLIGAYGNMN
jgi:hypothetical protein